MDRNPSESAGFVQPYYYQTASNTDLSEINCQNKSVIQMASFNIMETHAGLRDSCSDTDSGICADSSSESQHSPQQQQISANNNLLIIKPGHSHSLPRPPGGHRLLPSFPLCNPSQETSSPQWRLRKNFQNEQANNLESTNNFNSSVSQKRQQPLRVRFADEVSQNLHNHRTKSPNKTLPSNQQPTQIKASGRPPAPAKSAAAYYYSLGNSNPSSSANSFISHTFPKEHTNSYSNPKTMTIGAGDKATPPPPPYLAAVKRIREMKDRRIQFMESRHRSASLPRACARIRDEDNSNYVQVMRERAANFVLAGTGLSTAKSMDNLHVAQERRENRNSKTKSDRNPFVLPAESCHDIVCLSSDQGVMVPIPVQRPSIVSNKYRIPRPQKVKQNSPKFTQRVSSVTKLASNALKLGNDDHMSETGNKSPTSNAPPPDTISCTLPRPHSNPSLADRKLRIRLFGLDHCGIQTLEIEKLEPGPFGFYIATGLYKKKKGIFISRVNARCLSRLISIGDQLLEVDGVLVKGKTLEQVQNLIANRQKIVLKILPVIMR